MPLCKILVDFNSAEGWQRGQEVEITDPRILIAQGKVRLVKRAKRKPEPKVEEKKVEAAVEGAEAEVVEGFECEVCGKVCKSKAGLTSHMSTHKKEE